MRSYESLEVKNSYSLIIYSLTDLPSHFQESIYKANLITSKGAFSPADISIGFHLDFFLTFGPFLRALVATTCTFGLSDQLFEDEICYMGLAFSHIS